MPTVTLLGRHGRPTGSVRDSVTGTVFLPGVPTAVDDPDIVERLQSTEQFGYEFDFSGKTPAADAAQPAAADVAASIDPTAPDAASASASSTS